MTDLDRVTDLFEKWAAEEDEHRQAGEYGLAEGLRVAIEDLRAAVHGGRAETTTACTCDAAPAEIGGASHRPGCGEAETTTATTEDAAQAVADVIYNGDATMPGATRIAALLHERGLLATARTRPTREDVRSVMRQWFSPDDYRIADKVTDAVMALWADQPTESDVRDTSSVQAQMHNQALFNRKGYLR